MSVLESFGLPPAAEFQPRYNIAPSQEQLTISLSMDGKPELRPRKWGLVPYWATDETIGNRLINARAEGLASRPAFSWPFRHKRCLIIADGYYEWRKERSRKIPVFFHLSDHRPFTMAGLWERWTRGDTPLETCVIITTTASDRAAPVHDRMPAIFSAENAKRWIAKESSEQELLAMLSPYQAGDLECYDVTGTVNNPANDTAECIRPADEAGRDEAEELDLFSV